MHQREQSELSTAQRREVTSFHIRQRGSEKRRWATVRELSSQRLKSLFPDTRDRPSRNQSRAEVFRVQLLQEPPSPGWNCSPAQQSRWFERCDRDWNDWYIPDQWCGAYWPTLIAAPSRLRYFSRSNSRCLAPFVASHLLIAETHATVARTDWIDWDTNHPDTLAVFDTRLQLLRLVSTPCRDRHRQRFAERRQRTEK